MNERRIAGNSTASLALLLLALVGVGAWNYHRNYQLERASERERAYSGYSTHEVELLRDATASELETARVQFDRAQRRRAGSARDRGTVAGNVRQFDRTARASSAIRDAASDLSERESLKTALDQELSLRVGSSAGMALHLKRLTTF